jgi:hypothetical protein
MRWSVGTTELISGWLTLFLDQLKQEDCSKQRGGPLRAAVQLGRHCCIKAKGVLATHQSGEAGPSGTSENRNKPGIRDPLRGFWASRWTRSGEPIA